MGDLRIELQAPVLDLAVKWTSLDIWIIMVSK